MTKKNYNVGIYTRLSKDDERIGESISIENQKNILSQYAKEQGWNIHFTYVDDGYSGTNFERPQFQKMLSDIKGGEINLVLVKDLSRVGRNHVQVGHFIEDILPTFGCSIVALNNNVDTRDKNNSNNEMMGFLNLFNEFHARETSKKVRMSRKSCAERGMYMGTYAPFGYKKSEDNKHTLEIDEEMAPIVRRIFELRVKGASYRSIATMFNEEHIVSPRASYYQRKQTLNPQKNNHLWNAASVRDILLSEIYIGHMVQGKKGTMSYKNKKLITKDKDEWIRVENTHEPLIDMETWQKVSELSEKKYQTKRSTKPDPENIFVSLVYCSDCGFKMRYQKSKEKRKDDSIYQYVGFVCGNYSRSGKGACTAHIISENSLKEIVIAEIKALAGAVSYDEDAMTKRIMAIKNRATDDRMHFYKTQLKRNRNRIVELETFTHTLYADRIAGKVNERMFERLMEKYDTELTEKTKANVEIEQILSQYEEQTCDVAKWASTIKKYVALETLDKPILLELIERIEIGEVVKIEGKRTRSVKIIYRMVGDLTGIEESEVNEHEDTAKQAV